ncbi:phosphoribosyl-AMP cyclohydrolase [bacterium]|nr:phosphoribosyl-AMP cyclohydrolase [bacterium]NIN93122.1 phosphoribosyl-AMP cyclohydrolase [bacterium]NIO18071.1 phosphoribosyl-AMP cyclohydrolase [bacterium]NIO74056.1 phosphoribosyl-AMP cyclohydrolase [bacterium]
MKFIEELRFDGQGLIPAIVQDYEDGQILMLAYMNKESLEKTMATGKTCFWRRSQGRLWTKGEESGHFQQVKEIFFDCDGDTLLVKVKQLGGAACHKGYRSCFFRKVNEKGEYDIIGEKVFDPSKVYKKK